MSEVLWQSAVTEDMLVGILDIDVDRLIEELNDAVATICQDYGI